MEPVNSRLAIRHRVKLRAEAGQAVAAHVSAGRKVRAP